MFSNPSQQHAQGKLDETKGNMKSSIGDAVGSPGLSTEGKYDQAKGIAQQQAAAGGGYAAGVKNQVVGAANEYLGKMTGSEERQLDGAVQKNQGILQKDMHSGN